MEIQKFNSNSEMMDYIKTLKPADHYRISKSYGIKPATREDARLTAEYIVQGVSKGLSGPSLVQYAEASVKRLQNVLPHLAAPVTESLPVVDPTPVKESLPVAKPTVTKTPKAAKAPKVKTAKTKKAKYPNYSIVARPDRGGFEGWYGGRAEAFRTTVEKVQAFFMKKYGELGTLV